MWAICIKHTEYLLGPRGVKNSLVSDCFHATLAELKVDKRRTALKTPKIFII